MFHVITEELSQHVRSDSAFANQNLKFDGQMSNDRALIGRFESRYWIKEWTSLNI